MHGPFCFLDCQQAVCMSLLSSMPLRTSDQKKKLLPHLCYASGCNHAKRRHLISCSHRAASESTMLTREKGKTQPLLHRPLSAIHSDDTVKNCKNCYPTWIALVHAWRSCLTMCIRQQAAQVLVQVLGNSPQAQYWLILKWQMTPFLLRRWKCWRCASWRSGIRNSDDEEDDILKEMKVTKTQIRKIEEDTRGQSTNETGLCTDTCFSKLRHFYFTFLLLDILRCVGNAWIK